MTLEDLQKKGFLRESQIDDARALLALDQESERQMPGVARFSLGVGAWFAGFFLIGFILTAVGLSGSAEGAFVTIGGVFLAIGVTLLRIGKGVFSDQLGLALSFAGYVAGIFGMVGLLGEDFGSALVVALVLCPLVYWLSRNSVMRFYAVAWVWVMWFLLAFTEDGIGWLVSGLTLSFCVMLLGMSGWRPERIWNAATVASMLAFLVILWIMSSEMNSRYEPFFSDLFYAVGPFVAIGFAILLLFLEKGRGVASTLRIAIYALLGGAVGFAGAPGVAACLGLMIVAHARSERWVGWLAVIGLVAFLIQFYYFLDVSLMAKSLWLISTGMILLVLAAFSKPEVESPNRSTPPLSS
ncbi:MAG: DUF4401 domain-containing protein [Verrucomicrobiota bacterium]